MTHRIDRRDFLRQGTAAAAAMAVPVGPVVPGATAEIPTPAARVRDDVLDLADRQLDSRDFSLAVYDAIRPSLSFNATSPTAAQRWRWRARRKLEELLGGLPAEKVALRAETLETKDFGTYTRERVVFQTREHLSAIGYLLLPKEGKRPLPAVVCLPGHGRGADDVVGIEADGTQRTTRGTGYAKDYALQCVEHGYATFALEQLGFGARRDEAARRSGPATDSCRPAATSALLFGQTMAGWRVWDAMRTIDYLATRPEVDAKRVATLGASGGGTIALLTAALDARVRAAVVSAYFNTFRDSIVSISHCPDNYVPGMLQAMELYDLAGLVAPRALFVESGEKDRIFPIHGFRTAVERAERIYASSGTAEKFGSETHPGAHEFHGVGAFAFLAKQL